MTNLIDQNKGKAANKIFIETCQLYQKRARGVRQEYSDACKHAEIVAANIRPRANRLLAAEKFAELDKMGDELLASQAMFPSGIWYLGSFYSQLDSLAAGYTDERWQEHLGSLKKWAAQRPDSKHARIALAAATVSYGWKARGTGWGSSVTKEGWRDFASRLNDAHAILQTAPKNPYWYSVCQRVALGQSWEAAKYDDMVAECRKKYPSYAPVVCQKCWWLQPRWHGEEGEAESYLKNECDKVGGPAGDKLYARAVWYLDRFVLDKVFEETKMSWPRTKAGLIGLSKDYPKALSPRAQLSILAMEQDDVATAESAFAEER